MEYFLSDKKVLAVSTSDHKNYKNKENLLSLKEKYHINDIFSLYQTHSDKIHFINQINKEKFHKDLKIEGDGLYSDLKNSILGIVTADCVPILYYAPSYPLCGVTHNGWKGTKKGIHKKMISLWIKSHSIDPRDIYISIGPHIQNYEVGKEFLDYFEKKYLTALKEDKFIFNLQQKIVDDFQNLGILKEHICPTKIDTLRDSRFFSYRQGDKTKRFFTFIGLY